MTEPKQSHGKSIKWVIWPLILFMFSSFMTSDRSRYERYELVEGTNDAIFFEYQCWGAVITSWEYLKVQKSDMFGTQQPFSWDTENQKWRERGDGDWPQPPYDNETLNRGLSNPPLKPGLEFFVDLLGSVIILFIILLFLTLLTRRCIDAYRQGLQEGSQKE